MANDLNNAKFLIEDLIYGNQEIIERSDFNEFSYTELKQAMGLLLNNPNLPSDKKKYLLANPYRLIYRKKPPTPSEFLSEKWLGDTAKNIFPHVRAVFEAFLNPNYKKNTLILSTCIGFGKSKLSTWILLYIVAHLQLMHNPKKFFNVSEATSFAVVLLSFSQKKAKQVLFSPIRNVLKNSPMFQYTRDEVYLARRQKENPDKIIWTTSSKIGDLQFSADIHFVAEGDRAAFLGLDVIAGVASEISLFMQRGISAEEIWLSYSDLRNRIANRFGTRYLTATILDSSPIDMERSPIDKYIYSGQASQDEGNLVINATEWDVFGHDSGKYPIYSKTKETFPVYKGEAGKEPKIISEDEVSNYSPDTIIWFPTDKYELCKLSPAKALRDLAAIPASNIGKLVNDYHSLERMFTYQLKNLYGGLSAPANQIPEKLIWNKIKSIFFTHINGNTQFYRNHFEKRVIAVDGSLSTDVTGISMCHLEMNEKGERVCVFDFNFGIIPDKNKINLDAIVEFILDLRNEGHIDIAMVVQDGFESKNALQKLSRHGITVKNGSVDLTPTPYLVYVSWLYNNRIKVGKNIFLKNNLKSLQETERKSGSQIIDHLKGKLVNTPLPIKDWKIDTAGINAKDISDAGCNGFYYLINNLIDYVPKYQWLEDKEEVKAELEKINSQIDFNSTEKYEEIIKNKSSEIALKKAIALMDKEYISPRTTA